MRRLAAGLAAALVVAAGAASGAPPPLAQVNVSNAVSMQAEVAVAVDPADPNRLLGGSGTLDPFAVRVYASSDGGATWSSDRLEAPPAKEPLCAAGDPAVAIDRSGAQYYAFLAANCSDFVEERSDRLPNVVIVLASRTSASAPWTSRIALRHTTRLFDDKEALAVDNGAASPHRGRLYLAWTRITGRPPARVVFSWSDDHGVTWSRPVPVSDTPRLETFSGIAVGPTGDVYISWMTAGRQVFLDRSTDGGVHFGRDVLVDLGIGYPGGLCEFAGASVSIPAQPRRCVTMNPIVSVDGSAGPRNGTVYVTYGAAGGSGMEQNVYVAAFDPTLRPLLGYPSGTRAQVNAPDPASYQADQFLPVAALDQTTGDLWACFYDTTGDRHRIKSWFSCTVSTDGGLTWPRAVRVASTPSNETVRRGTSFEYGDYEGLAAAAGVAHPLWTDTRQLATALREEIYTAAVPRESVAAPAAR